LFTWIEKTLPKLHEQPCLLNRTGQSLSRETNRLGLLLL